MSKFWIKLLNSKYWRIYWVTITKWKILVTQLYSVVHIFHWSCLMSRGSCRVLLHAQITWAQVIHFDSHICCIFQPAFGAAHSKCGVRITQMLVKIYKTYHTRLRLQAFRARVSSQAQDRTPNRQPLLNSVFLESFWWIYFSYITDKSRRS